MDIRGVERDTLVMEMVLAAKTDNMDQFNEIKTELERRNRDQFEGAMGD